MPDLEHSLPTDTTADLDERSCILPLDKKVTGTCLGLALVRGGWSYAGQALSEMGVDMISDAIELSFEADTLCLIDALSSRLARIMNCNLWPLALHSFPEGWRLRADVMEPYGSSSLR